MKYDIWKIKSEHHSLKEFSKDLINIAKIPKIQRIIPGRISRQQKWSSMKSLSFSYYTYSWLKLIMKKWATAQEIFVICSQKDRDIVKCEIFK